VMEVVVEDKQLSLAIGKKGQNVRLAAKLTGWRIDIKSEEEKRKEVEAQLGALEIPAEESIETAETTEDVVQTADESVETAGELVETSDDIGDDGETPREAAAASDTPADESRESK
jgi:N utilization substance protein A